MSLTILNIIYLLLGFTLVIIAGYLGDAINQLMGIRIQRPHLQLKDKSNLPGYLNDVFENGLQQLKHLGFEFHHCQYAVDIICHQRNDKWSTVLFNADTNVYAEISPASSFLDLPGYEIDFWSISPDGTALITMNGRGHTILCGITNAEIHDPMAITLEDVYKSHLNEQKDVFGDKALSNMSGEIYIKTQQKLFDSYFLNLINERAAISTGNNEFQLTFAKARRLLPQIFRGKNRLRKLLHDRLVLQDAQSGKLNQDDTILMSGNNFSTEAEVNSYLRMRSVQERTPGGLTAKLALFFLLLVLSYFAFDLTFSLYSVLILLAVIILHEAGHLAAMAVFGFRNYQIFFFPLIANHPKHENKDPTIWKQTIVHLMGPLPGIILGITLLGIYQDLQINWVYETAIVLLIFNYLNLLPIVPLDGGYIIRYTIMERFPSGKLIFSGMGGLAFAAGGWYLGEPIFWVLAAILFSTLPWSALEAGVLSELFEPTSDFESLNKEARLLRLFDAFRQPKFNNLQYLQKFNLVKGLSDTLLLPKQLGRIGAIGLNSIYLGALILTPPVAIITIIGMDNTAEIVAKIQGKTPEKDWDTLINNETNPDSKFDAVLNAARFYTSTNNFEKAQSYLEQAEKTLALIYSETFLEKLYDTYAFFYLNKGDLEEAEEYQLKVITLQDQSPEQNAFELATSYQLLASIHNFRKPQRSLLDLKTALSYALNIKTPDERFIIISVANQLLNKHYDKNNFDSARTMLLDTLSVIKRYQDAPSMSVAGYLHQELAWTYTEMGNWSFAIEQFEHALLLSDKNGNRLPNLNEAGYDTLSQANIYLAMAVAQNKAGNTNSAQSYLQRANELVKSSYNETLSSYVKNNYSAPFTQSNLQQAKVATVSNRNIQRWKLISDLVNSYIPVATQYLKLPNSGNQTPGIEDKSGTNTSDSETPTLNAVQIKSQSPVKQLESQQKFQQQNQIEASEVQKPSIEQPALP